jgi:hypothetical protein
MIGYAGLIQMLLESGELDTWPSILTKFRFVQEKIKFLMIFNMLVKLGCYKPTPIDKNLVPKIQTGLQPATETPSTD